MDKTKGIMRLFASGMSERLIARTLDIDRESVDREFRAHGAKGGSSAKAPTGSRANDSDAPKGAKAPTGCENSHPSTVEPLKIAQEVIVQKRETGLDAHGCIRTLCAIMVSWVVTTRSVVTFVIWEIGSSIQCDVLSYLQRKNCRSITVGARCKDHTGRLRKIPIFRCIFSYSRKG
jgi:hypothetical protein